MYAAGPRLDRRLLDAVDRLDDRSVPMAETYRRLREVADAMGVPRPSYERIRVHLRAARATRDGRRRARDLAFELAYNTRPADAVLADLLELLE